MMPLMQAKYLMLLLLLLWPKSQGATQRFPWKI